MTKIKNSSVDNAYGGGKQEIFTDDNGKEYIIKNSSLDNVYGDGKQKIVTENKSGSGDCLADWLTDVVPWWVWIIFFVVLFIIQRIIAT